MAAAGCRVSDVCPGDGKCRSPFHGRWLKYVGPDTSAVSSISSRYHTTYTDGAVASSESSNGVHVLETRGVVSTACM